MDDIDALLETLRVLCANLASLKLMNGPEFLLPGRTERYQETIVAAQQGYKHAENQIQEIGQQLAETQQRLDAGVKQFGWHQKE